MLSVCCNLFESCMGWIVSGVGHLRHKRKKKQGGSYIDRGSVALEEAVRCKNKTAMKTAIARSIMRGESGGKRSGRELRGESVGFLKPLLLIFIQKSVFYPALLPFLPVSITALIVIGETRPLAHSINTCKDILSLWSKHCTQLLKRGQWQSNWLWKWIQSMWHEYLMAFYRFYMENGL